MNEHLLVCVAERLGMMTIVVRMAVQNWDLEFVRENFDGFGFLEHMDSDLEKLWPSLDHDARLLCLLTAHHEHEAWQQRPDRDL